MKNMIGEDLNVLLEDMWFGLRNVLNISVNHPLTI